MADLKLYVCGANSPDPDEWDIWFEPALVLAHSPEEAKELGGYHSEVCEIPLTGDARMLMRAPEPHMGEDI